MGYLPILQKDEKQGTITLNESLPTFYMSDYSVLGLCVGKLDQALQILNEKKFAVINKSGRLEIAIDGIAQMSEIVNLFRQNGIGCEIADIVNQVYQG